MGVELGVAVTLFIGSITCVSRREKGGGRGRHKLCVEIWSIYDISIVLLGILTL